MAASICGFAASSASCGSSPEKSDDSSVDFMIASTCSEAGTIGWNCPLSISDDQTSKYGSALAASVDSHPAFGWMNDASLNQRSGKDEMYPMNLKAAAFFASSVVSAFTDQ